MSWAEDFGFSGDLVQGVQLADACFNAVVEFDNSELQRRQSVGLGAVLDLRLLRVMESLPESTSVPSECMQEDALDMLTSAPAGVVQTVADSIVRIWRPSLRLNGVFVLTSTLTEGIENVSLLVSDSTRGVVTREYPDDSELERAQRMGIGVIHASKGRGEILVAAEPTIVKVGAVHWFVTEHVLNRWLALQSRRAA